MTPEQEMRTVAIQAAASFCAPLGTVEGGQAPQIPALDQVLFVADVFHGYILGGAEEARRIENASAPREPEPEAPQAAETQFRLTGVGANLEIAVQPPAVPVTVPVPSPVSAVQVPVEAPVEPEAQETPADIIPLAARGSVSAEQFGARRKIESTRRRAAEGILNRSRVAKLPKQKEDLVVEAEQKGLSDFVLDVGDGTVMQLGAYLDSL